MKKSALLLIALFGIGLLVVGGAWINRRSSPAPNGSAKQAGVVYTCPMHPAYRSDHPGDCPMCGMRLVPVSSGGEGTACEWGCEGCVRHGAGRAPTSSN